MCHSFQKCLVLQRKIHLSGYYKMRLNLWWQAWQQITMLLACCGSDQCSLLSATLFSMLLQCKCISEGFVILYSGRHEICRKLFQCLWEIASYLCKSLRVIKNCHFLKACSTMLSFLMFSNVYAFTIRVN